MPSAETGMPVRPSERKGMFMCLFHQVRDFSAERSRILRVIAVHHCATLYKRAQFLSGIAPPSSADSDLPTLLQGSWRCRERTRPAA
jgi:hypothetical protein